ncbi:protein HUA2-LIKE 3-like isoform X2 [Salvia miltiorrhiza]|uniref:protein HUA2-LIKE 3-like isoform X2 n=1 Tax=Salvia miltiorrhiza TaxID=226208 RepID=UPI0025AC2727|nr:protein HUA2-LIKE 3-like isoform X2 [Salvia miltiorrhiza]
MAPSRRKGANKAAATAAARRKWKVGDLVLAKVKGFPAWPATVSEPEKWGYTADWKKVVVHFFGTEQIAFCNPADVEEFTEEKKVSLLGRRHGKGADFVRAVNEIIDCFEKLKKQDQGTKANGTDGADIANENIDGSLTECVKDDGVVVTVKQLSTGTTNDLNSLTEAALAAAAEDALHDEEMQLNEIPSKMVSPETPTSATYLVRDQSDVGRPKKSGLRRRKSTRVLRSSSRVDASRPQSTLMPSTSNTRSSRRAGANVSDDRSLRRSKRIVKSTDDSVGEDVDSLAFVSSDSNEESDSGIMTMNYSTNDGSTGDSSCKPVGLEQPLTENNEGETELSNRLDFQSNNIVFKKKRKPNRKRHNNDTVEAAKPDVVASDSGILKNACVSPTFSEKAAQKYAKDDGDQHLPLVKRARVRMGMPLPTAEEEVTLVLKEEKISEAPRGLVTESSEPLSLQVDRADTGSVREGPTFSSPLHARVVKPILYETGKNYVDGEAALPPSKRLHRALEAMSANVAGDCERASDCSAAPNIQSNGYCPSFLESPELSMEKRAKVELESESTKSLRNGDSLVNASAFCMMSDAETPKNDTETVLNCVKTHGIESSDPVFCRGSVEGADNKRLKLSMLNDAPAETDAEHHVKQDSLNVSEQSTNLNCIAAGTTISSANHCKTVCSDLKEVAEKSDPDISQMNSDSDCVEGIGGCSPNDDTRVQLDSADGGGDETNKTKHLLLPENNHDSKRTEFVEEACSPLLSGNTPAKVLNSGHRHSILHSASISYGHIEDRTVSITQSTSSLTDGAYGAKASPPSSSICNLASLDSNNEHNSSSSTDVQLHQEKAKLSGKCTSKDESLSSFQAIIRSLTRTKESIGRATRIAIDCAKLGFATKVVEILARNLESQSSLHKKVDLFFLVDSITQCSRGIKGDGGVYPSAIQALLPRLLLAAAPRGGSSRENHRQCLKVLRVWQERKIFPEPIIRHHIRELDVLCGTGSYSIVGSQQPQRNERAFDDPIREMEGMLVDEYGRDVVGGSDSDGEGYEAVTPEHNVESHDGEKTPVPAVEKCSHILEDVDAELEMEDVAPCCEGEIASTSNIAGADQTVPNHQPNNHYGVPFTPQQPKEGALTSTTSSSSTLPPPPHAPSLHTPAGSAFSNGVCNSVPNGPESKPYSSRQECKSHFLANRSNKSVFARIKPAATDAVHHHVRENEDFEGQRHRQMPDSNSACSYSDRPTSHVSGRASNSSQQTDSLNKGFHLRPPHPAPSNQFSYVHEQRIQSRRNAPPSSHSNRFHTRGAENGNFYKVRGRNKFVPHDNIGESWRPPFPSISGPCYPDDRSPMSYSGPPCEPPFPNNRWNFPPRPMNHRHFNYMPSSEGPFPVANRGHFWRPR